MSEEIFERHVYELIQVIPVQDYYAVYAEEPRIAGKEFYLWRSKIDALGLAKVRINVFRSVVGGMPRPIGSRRGENEIVGLCLADGFWHIVQNNANFAGLCREYDDIETCTGCLDPEYAIKFGKDERAQQNGGRDE